MTIKMTRSHFELIADTISATEMDAATKADIAMNFASVLHDTNSAFNEEIFLYRCGVTDEDGAVVCHYTDNNVEDHYV